MENKDREKMSSINIFYTVDYHRYDDGSFNGLRTINVYKIENNIPKLLTELECKTDDLGNEFMSDEEEIQEFLDGIGEEGLYDSFYNLSPL